MSAQVMLLRLRLWLMRRSAVLLAGVLLCGAGSAAWLWQMPQARLQRALAGRPVVAADRAALAVAPAPAADRNLSDFYDALGESRYAEQQLKTLFGIAAKTGLTLSAGQYKAAENKEGRMRTYQIMLPVKGSYRAVWQFCLQTLAEIPFASLDELSFRRDAVADATVEARVRFTLYLRDGGPKR